MPFFNLLLTMNRHQYMQVDLLKGQEFVVRCHFNSLNMECVSKDHGNSKSFIWFAFSSLRSHVNTSKLTTKKNWKENLVLFFFFRSINIQLYPSFEGEFREHSKKLRGANHF
jgi:hypothetical protein